MPICYKIVRSNRLFDGGFSSFGLANCGIEYKLNVPSRPTLANSKLFAFNSCKAAMEFWKDISPGKRDYIYHLFECEAPEFFTACFCALDTYDIERFWTGQLRNDLVRSAPIGTVFVNELTLKKELAVLN